MQVQKWGTALANQLALARNQAQRCMAMTWQKAEVHWQMYPHMELALVVGLLVVVVQNDDAVIVVNMA
jgi:hypothetical protein